MNFVKPFVYALTAITLTTSALAIRLLHEPNHAQPAGSMSVANTQHTQHIELQETHPRYLISESERTLIESVVMAEAGGETLEGQMAVAQCILNACEAKNMRPEAVIVMYRYAEARPEPSQSVKDAVEQVFGRGETVTEERIMYFYAPALVESPWHESQQFVLEIGGHRFFK